MSTPDTKNRIISAAETLFSQHGFAGTSLRNVTSEAGVNLAAIHYHFGTTDALLRAVFTRRIEPVNQRRLEMLDAAEAAAGDRAPELEAVLEAFLSPIIDLKRDIEGEGIVWSRFIGRIYSEPTEVVENLMREQFDEILQRFLRALGHCLPELGEAEIVERLQFTIGAMSHALVDLHQRLMPDYPSATGADLVQHLVIFTSAAFRAPSAYACQDRHPERRASAS